MSGNISSDKVTALVGSGGAADRSLALTTPSSTTTGPPATTATTPPAILTTSGDCICGATPSIPPRSPTGLTPKPFLGEDEFGRFAWIKRGDAAARSNFIIHQGDAKDTPDDRFFDANANPEIWINQGDATIYTTQADAQGFVDDPLPPRRRRLRHAES